MTKTERILLGTILASGLAAEIGHASDISFLIAGAGILLISFGWLLIYYLINIKRSVFTIVIIIWLIQLVASLFKILHLTGADELMWVGYWGQSLFAVVLLWSIYKAQPRPDTFYYVIAIALLVQSAFYISHQFRFEYYGELLNYLIVGGIGTVKMKELKLKPEVDRLLNLYLVQSILFLIGQLFRNL